MCLKSIVYSVDEMLIFLCVLRTRIQNAVTNDEAIFVLWVLHAISSPLQGFFNSVAFALDKETLSRLNPTQMKVLAIVPVHYVLSIQYM